MTTDLATAAVDTSPEDREKIDRVFRAILSGAAEATVLAFIRQQWPEDDPGPLIVAAIARYQKAGQFDPTTVRGWCFEAYRDLYRQLVAGGNLAEAVRTVKMIAELAGR